MTYPKAISRRTVLTAIAAGAACPALAGAPDMAPRPARRVIVQPGLEQIVADSGLGAVTSVIVADADTGRTLEAFRPGISLPPASVTKAATALYAVETLGLAHRFRTRLIATGPISGGTLRGDLVLVGGGDPDLDTDALADLAAALARTGLRRISGRFLVHSGALPHVHEIDDGQPDPASYNPAISGLNLDYNRVHFTWVRASSGLRTAVEAVSARQRIPVGGIRVTTASRESPVFTYSNAGGRDHWSVAASALRKNGGRWLPVRLPHLHAAEVFSRLAAAQGVTLPAAGEATRTVSGNVLAEAVGDPLRDVTREMLKYSNNLTAECLGLSSTIAQGERPGSLRTSAARMTQWARRRASAQGLDFVDHSGLGERSRVTADALVAFLLAAGYEGPLGNLMKEVPVAREAGSKERLGGTRVVAKTGTLNFVKCLAGYQETRSGRRVAFAILSGDLAVRGGLDSESESPRGSKTFANRAVRLQDTLLRRWALEAW